MLGSLIGRVMSAIPVFVWACLVLILCAACFMLHTRALMAEKEAAAIRSEYQAAQLEAQRARADYQARLAQTNAAIMKLGIDAARRITENENRTPARVQIVERVSRENPDFAATVRPADLAGVRSQQISELIEAANRGADLSGRSVSSLQGTN